MDVSHCEHAAVYGQNTGDKLTTKKGRSSIWHKSGNQNLPLLRTCHWKQSSASPILTPSYRDCVCRNSGQWCLCNITESALLLINKSAVLCPLLFAHHLWSTRIPSTLQKGLHSPAEVQTLSRNTQFASCIQLAPYRGSTLHFYL